LQNNANSLRKKNAPIPSPANTRVNLVYPVKGLPSRKRTTEKSPMIGGQSSSSALVDSRQASLPEGRRQEGAAAAKRPIVIHSVRDVQEFMRKTTSRHEASSKTFSRRHGKNI
jgi:hypothetical protein